MRRPSCASSNPTTPTADRDPADGSLDSAPPGARHLRSRFEHAQRYFQTDTRAPREEASSRTPLHDTSGIITPSCCISNVIILPYRRRTGRPASRFVPSKGIRSGCSYRVGRQRERQVGPPNQGAERAGSVARGDLEVHLAWPYATTVWDYVRRSMPRSNGRSRLNGVTI